MRNVNSSPKIWLMLALAIFFSKTEARGEINVTRVMAEMLENPVGIDAAQPRLSWQIESDAKCVVQKSYRILVASSEGALKAGKADLWDSGPIVSDRQNYISYGGKALQSREKCYWKVLVKTNKGKAWSSTESWQTGLLLPSDWQAAWIGHDYSDDLLKGNTRLRARYLRKDFNLGNAIEKATLYISGLGLYEAYLNGHRIGTQELSPGPTDYNVSVKYNTFDVTSLLQSGQNAIGVILGNGRYVAMRNPGTRHFGTPKLIAQLEISLKNGQTVTVNSDNTWKISNQGPTGWNSGFDGEQYDARMEMAGWNQPGFDDSRWQQAEKVTAPKGLLNAQMNPSITVMDKIKPVSIKETEPNVYILDMGQNMVGRLRSTFHNGQPGQEVKLHFVETLKADGSIYTANLRTAETTDTYVMKGDNSETWAPSFTYHGFRFVEIRGLKSQPSTEDFLGEVLYDEMATTGSIETSNSVFNQVYKNAYWGIRGNYRGMPTDCPQRDERMGWTGDRAAGALGECYIFDNHLLYAKWMDDIGNDQRADGALSDVNPIYWGVYSDNMTWPGAWLTISGMLYDQYGDAQPIKKHYLGMKRWMDHMKDKYMKDFILTKDTYGDWCMPPEKLELIHSKDSSRITKGALISTSYYYMLAQKMQQFAEIAGHKEDVDYWQTLAVQIRDAFNNKFLDKKKSCYGNNTVTANILPLRFGMTPLQHRADIVKNIVDKTTGEFQSHVSTGLIGIQQLMRGLSDYGQSDLAFTIASNTTYPSWGYMAKNGATTIWELWNGNTADPAMNSGNHVMLLGDLIIWTYEYLGGIAQEKGSAGFKQIMLKPRPASQLSYVNAAYQSIYGKIVSNWKKNGNKMQWSFRIPCNTSATVYLPAKEANEKIAKHAGGKYVKDLDGYKIFTFSSGNYSLEYEQ